jgi:hypothetical protein
MVVCSPIGNVRYDTSENLVGNQHGLGPCQYLCRFVRLTVTVPCKLALELALLVALMYYGTYIVRPATTCNPVEYNMGYSGLTLQWFTTCFVIYIEGHAH